MRKVPGYKCRLRKLHWSRQTQNYWNTMSHLNNIYRLCTTWIIAFMAKHDSWFEDCSFCLILLFAVNWIAFQKISWNYFQDFLSILEFVTFRFFVEQFKGRVNVPLDRQSGQLKSSSPSRHRLPYFVYTGCQCRRPLLHRSLLLDRTSLSTPGVPV